MSRLYNILKYQYRIWTLIIGIVLIIAGFCIFFYIQEMENVGRVIRFNRKFQFVYRVIGKYGVLAIFEILGWSMLISGIRELRSKE